MDNFSTPVGGYHPVQVGAREDVEGGDEGVGSARLVGFAAEAELAGDEGGGAILRGRVYGAGAGWGGAEGCNELGKERVAVFQDFCGGRLGRVKRVEQLDVDLVTVAELGGLEFDSDWEDVGREFLWLGEGEGRGEVGKSWEKEDGEVYSEF